MHPQLEALLRAWDTYLSAQEGAEADGLLATYEAQLEEISSRAKVSKALMHRAVLRAYQRWQWADDPKFPRELRKSRLD